MQVAPRFETTIPKARFSSAFFSPPKTITTPRGSLGIVAIIALTFLATVQMITSRQPAAVSKAPAAPVLLQAPPAPPAPPVPEVRLPTPVTSSTAVVPRAKLIHVRPIGTFENDTMPDGRVIGTTYRGELPSVANLPRIGAQLGDMWFTRNDGHCWVLAPIAAGSQTIGWVDP